MTRNDALRAAVVPLLLLEVAAVVYLALPEGVRGPPFFLCLALAAVALIWLALAPRPPAPVKEQLILDGLGSRWLLLMLPPTVGLILFAQRVWGVGPLAWAWATPAGLFLAALAFRVGRMDRGPFFATAIALVLVCVPFAFGIVVGLDALLDRSAPRVQTDRVDDMVYGGGRYSQTARLYLSGPDGRREVNVSASLYARFQVGGGACLLFRKGAFGLEWFDVKPCA